MNLSSTLFAAVAPWISDSFPIIRMVLFIPKINRKPWKARLSDLR